METGTPNLQTENEGGWTAVKNVLGIRDFRLLWLGESISLLGDQFSFIALPWLVLQLTNDAFAMGIVLAIAGIPRALFMLFGGALTDRFSPRRLMLLTNIARMFLVAALSFLILSSVVQLWMIYLFALLFGLADAFFYPAASAIVPTILPKHQLQIGNSITQGTAQLSVFLGPMLAGLVIAFFANQSAIGANEAAVDIRGIGIAFGLDAVTFFLSAAMLKLMRHTAVSPANTTQNVWQSIKEGLLYVWNDRTLRTVFIVVAALTVLSVAPITIGIPVLADEYLENGAAAFGILMSAYGAGALAGIILSGILPKPPEAKLGTLLFIAVSGMGFLMAGLAFARTMWLAGGLLLAIGVLDGWVIIQFTTWLQIRSPEALLGRIMSLLMFAFVGLAPVADTVFGGLVEWNFTAVVFTSGLLLALISLAAAFQPSIREMGTGVNPATGD
ncbi:MAG: MFS transporter [Chloroflexi bacterium]|nr:MFS transporter [Chloroflexota bacterium]